MSDVLTSEASEGLGSGGDGRSLSEHRTESAGDALRTGFQQSPPGSSLPPSAMKDLMDFHECTTSRTSLLNRPLPLSYDIDVKKAARKSEEAKVAVDEHYREHFDENNMPRHPQDARRSRASWEMKITDDHRALVLLLYRHILKGLINFKSIRRRSLISYARLTFRRRAAATEKLLIDECIEEARRALYVIGKHHAFTETREYEYDSMTMPKDTGQDVKTYMEEVYDPEISRQQFQRISDVQPGKEHLHTQGLGPTSGPSQFRKNSSGGDGGGNGGAFKIEIKDEDKSLRPPPPPSMMS